MPHIPKAHTKYDVLPNCKKYGFEIFIWDNELLKKIEKLTNMTDYMGLCPYQRYRSYEEFLDEISNLINKFPKYEQEIIEYKDSIIKMNNKEQWAIIQYIGETNFGFTKGRYYYVPMYIENNSWIFSGIIDNEEYSVGVSWNPPINLNKDFKIIIDPSNKLKDEFSKKMNMINDNI